MKVRWGIIGCGDVVRKRVAGAIIGEPRSQLIAACRRDQEKLHDFCDAFKVQNRYTVADELIDDPMIDAVYIATPVVCHMEQTVAAAKSGKHVLVEKPMAMTTAQCDQMICTCREADVKLGVAYYRRFYPMLHRIKQLLADGTIGRPLSISAITSNPLTDEPTQQGDWRVLPDQSGGGSLMDIGSHRIDLFLDLFGEIDGVKAQHATPTARYSVEQMASLSLRFRSGALGTLLCYFGTNAALDELSLVGTEGRIVVPRLNGSMLILYRGTESQTEDHAPPSNLCSPLIEDFVNAIREDRPPTVTGLAGRQTNEVMERAYADAVTGSRV